MKGLALSVLLLPLAAFGVVLSPAELEALPKAPTEMKVLIGPSGKPTVGDIVVLTVTPPNEDSTAEPAEAEKLKSEPVKWGEGRILWWKAPEQGAASIRVGLTTYKPGPFEIGPIPFIKDGKAVFASQAQRVEFSSIGQQGEDDIYPPEAVSFPQWVWVVLGLFTLAAVLGALFWLKRWSERRKAAVEELARAPRVYTPAEEFERVRHETDQKKLIEKAQFKPHYFALSEASKRFLGRAFRFDAEERTTRELVRELESVGLTSELIDKWEKIFEEMDVTKFTDQLPETNSALSLSARLSQLVAASYRLSPVAREALAVQTPAGGKR